MSEVETEVGGEGPIVLPVCDPATRVSGRTFLVEGALSGLELIRRDQTESLRFVEFDNEGRFEGLWEFDSSKEAGAENGFNRTLCNFLGRLGYEEASAHPFIRGIAVREPEGDRMLAVVDKNQLFNTIDGMDEMRAAARHFELLRKAYLYRDWWHSKKTCWVLTPPGYDFRHVKAVLNIDLPEMSEDQRVFLQLSYHEDQFLEINIWEPEVIVALEGPPTYDLETDEIPELDIMVLPGGELNRGLDGGADRLVRDLLPVLPNNYEPFRWQFAVDKATRRLPPETH